MNDKNTEFEKWHESIKSLPIIDYGYPDFSTDVMRYGWDGCKLLMQEKIKLLRDELSAMQELIEAKNDALKDAILEMCDADMDADALRAALNLTVDDFRGKK